jgi:hypothetical protein
MIAAILGYRLKCPEHAYPAEHDSAAQREGWLHPAAQGLLQHLTT